MIIKTPDRSLVQNWRFDQRNERALNNRRCRKQHNNPDVVWLASTRPGRRVLSAAIAHHPVLLFLICCIEDEAVYGRFAAFFVDYITQNKHTYDNLDLELDNIFTALHTAAALPDKSNLITGIDALCEFLFMRGMYQEVENYLAQAQQATEQGDNTVGLAQILAGISNPCAPIGRYTSGCGGTD